MLHRTLMRTRLQDLPSSRPCVAIAPHARLALHRYPEQSRLAGPCQPVFQPGNRSLAARSSKDDKSWSQLLGDAADLAKTAVSKVTNSIQSVLAPKSGDTSSPGKMTRSEDKTGLPTDFDRQLPAMFGGGIVGRLMGGLVGGLVKQVGKEMAKSGADRDEVVKEAVAILSRSSKLRSRMGQVQVSSMPMSQSVSSMSLNGVRTQQISIVLPVSGATGQTAYARVDSSKDGKGRRDTKISVQMPGGDVMMVNDGDSGDQGGAGGRTIDVDYTEIK